LHFEFCVLPLFIVMLKKLFPFFFITLFLVLPFPSLAEDTSEQLTEGQQQLVNIQREMRELEQEIARLRSEEVNLQNQISYFDNQIYLTTLQIDEAQTKINAKQEELVLLGEDIGALQERLGRLGEAVEFQDDVLNERVRARYKSSRISALEVIFGGESLGEMVARVKYLKVMEAQDRRLLNQMKTTRDNYRSQKTLLEEKKAEVEVIKGEIESQKAVLGVQKTNLDVQRVAKADLLAVTQNDEKKFQELLAAARKEKEQIEAAIGFLLQSGEARHVERGELIGLMGNTGYSTGPHLHFGVYNASSLADYTYYSNYENPLGYLQPMEVTWDVCPGCEMDACYREGRSSGSGSWDWPLDDPIISQDFGTTCWSNQLYGGREHTGIDMYVPSWGNASIKAVEEGEAYFYRGGQQKGNGVFIFHPNGKMTLYWHLR